MKRKIALTMAACLMLSVFFTACSGKVTVNSDQQAEENTENAITEEAPEEPAEPAEAALTDEPAAESEAPAAEEEAAEAGTEAAAETLPAYEYPGPELFYSVLYQYLLDEYASSYPEADVSIPCPVIVYEDETDNSEIKVYGNFWIFNYDLNGETLECKSGGSYPGCIHVKNTDAGYEVTSMDVVADGSGFTESAKEIFGEHYDAFMKEGEDEEYREELRAQIIANYVFDKELNITAYQDYGWDPVPLPEENIDTFYSNL